jgi:hypothetical protein
LSDGLDCWSAVRDDRGEGEVDGEHRGSAPGRVCTGVICCGIQTTTDRFRDRDISQGKLWRRPWNTRVADGPDRDPDPAAASDGAAGDRYRCRVVASDVDAVAHPGRARSLIRASRVVRDRRVRDRQRGERRGGPRHIVRSDPRTGSTGRRGDPGNESGPAGVIRADRRIRDCDGPETGDPAPLTTRRSLSAL